MPGSLGSFSRPGVLRWKSDSFLTPFEFAVDEVQSIRFPTADKLARPVGAFGFELTGGDVLFGSIVSLDDKTAELDVAKLGRMRVDRSRVRRIFRWRDGANLVYNGPNGLTGWREVAPAKARTQQQAARGGSTGPTGAYECHGVQRGREHERARAQAGPARRPAGSELGRGGRPAHDLQGRRDHSGRCRPSRPGQHRARAFLEADAGFPDRARRLQRRADGRAGLPLRGLGGATGRPPRDGQGGRPRLDPAGRQRPGPSPTPALPRSRAGQAPGLLGERRVDGRPEAGRPARPGIAGGAPDQRPGRPPARTAEGRSLGRRDAPPARGRPVAHPTGRSVDRPGAGRPVRRRDP